MRLFPGLVWVCAVAVTMMVTLAVWAQRASSTARQVTLRQQFIEAQTKQERGDLEGAASGYRSFLSHAEAELAEGYVLAADYPEAVQRMEDALSLSRENDLLLRAARTFLLAGAADPAAAVATELLHAQPEQKELLAGAHQVMGRVLLKQQHFPEARKEFEQATALDPTFLNGYDLAVACLDVGDEACATRIFGEMQNSFGDKAQLHIAFGRAYGDSDFQARAITEFQRAIAEDPRIPGTHYLLAAVLLANGGDESARVGAEHELMEELRLSPHDAPTYATLGQIALIEKEYPKAEELLKKAIIYGPQLPEGYLYLGEVYFNMGMMEEAEEALQSCIRTTHDVARNRYQVQKAHYLLGRILMQQGHPEEGHAELELSREFSNRALAMDKGRLAGEMGTAHDAAVQVAMPDAAETTAAEGQSSDPHAVETVKALEANLRPVLADGYNNLGAIAATHNQFVEATTDFRHAAEWNPKLEGLDYNWGRAAFAGGEYAEAVGPLLRYVAAHDDDAGARSVLAVSEFQTSNYQGCVDALRPVDGKVELTPQVAYMYSEALMKTGHIDEAIDHLTPLAAANADVHEIQRALIEARALRDGSKK